MKQLTETIYVNFKRLVSFKLFSSDRLFIDNLYILMNKPLCHSKDENFNVCIILCNSKNPDKVVCKSGTILNALWFPLFVSRFAFYKSVHWVIYIKLRQFLLILCSNHKKWEYLRKKVEGDLGKKKTQE